MGTHLLKPGYFIGTGMSPIGMAFGLPPIPNSGTFMVRGMSPVYRRRGDRKQIRSAFPAAAFWTYGSTGLLYHN